MICSKFKNNSTGKNGHSTLYLRSKTANINGTNEPVYNQM